jgi:hypothetical protein
MNARLERLQQVILEKLAQQGGELDASSLHYEFHQNDRVLVKKALLSLKANNDITIDFGMVTRNLFS